MPRWNAISVSGYHIRDAGSTAAQEMGFALANAIAYMDAVLEREISIDDFASRISWIFNTQNNFFQEVAKYPHCAGCGPQSCASSTAPRSRPA